MVNEAAPPAPSPCVPHTRHAEKPRCRRVACRRSRHGSCAARQRYQDSSAPLPTTRDEPVPSAGGTRRLARSASPEALTVGLEVERARHLLLLCSKPRVVSRVAARRRIRKHLCAATRPQKDSWPAWSAAALAEIALKLSSGTREDDLRNLYRRHEAAGTQLPTHTTQLLRL